MRLILDSNVFVAAFTEPRPPALTRLLLVLMERAHEIDLVVSRTILAEVKRNLSPQNFDKCWGLLHALRVAPVEEWQVPFDLGAKYQAAGFKPGDAFIAALGESADVDYLVSENRHFMDRSRVPFRVVRVADLLGLLER